MMINNSAYGGFILSNNVLDGVPIRYTYREKSEKTELNGWTILSEKDDDDYLRNPANFKVVSASTVEKIHPMILVLFDAPYGTDLFWEYKQGVLVGFYDLKKNKETSIEEILSVDTSK